MIVFLWTTILLVVVTIYEGIIGAKLWEWFVADTFGILAISTAQAIGISILVNMWTMSSAMKREEDADKVMGYSILIPTMAFIVGLIVVQYV